MHSLVHCALAFADCTMLQQRGTDCSWCSYEVLTKALRWLASLVGAEEKPVTLYSLLVYYSKRKTYQKRIKGEKPTAYAQTFMPSNVHLELSFASASSAVDPGSHRVQPPRPPACVPCDDYFHAQRRSASVSMRGKPGMSSPWCSLLPAAAHISTSHSSGIE